MNTLISIVISTFVISLIAFVGVLALAIRENVMRKILMYMVSLSAGILMGNAFLHLLPEAFGTAPVENIFLSLLGGFIFFFIIERFFHWHHCHDKHCKEQSFAMTNLIGNAVHNFFDGLIISAGFIASPGLGIVTTLAIASHEIPQKIGEFCVLVYGKYKKRKAMIMNFVSSMSVVFGGITGFILSGQFPFMEFLLPFAAGGFIYIAASDLIPELKKETELLKTALNIFIFSLGIAFMYFLTIVGV